MTFQGENTSVYEGYILHKHCPFDYCRSTTEPVYLNLNIQGGSDTQCAFNCSRKLCGSCKEGLSVAFGSSRFIGCSSAWFALVFVFAIACFALILFLQILNLTVSVGTINGLIFYANVSAKIHVCVYMHVICVYACMYLYILCVFNCHNNSHMQCVTI